MMIEPVLTTRIEFSSDELGIAMANGKAMAYHPLAHF